MIKNKRIHFIGIGGISMSALAKYLSLNNYVQGSDIVLNEEIQALKQQNIPVFIGHNKNNMKNIDLCVYNNAIDAKNEELEYAIKNNIEIIERSQLLGLIAKEFETTIAVSGTHGKTTTTAMISKVMLDCNLKPTIHIGGHFDYIDGNFKIGSNKYFVTEACEYKKSFLNLHPQYTIINNVELDHTDCYNNLTELYDAFKQLVNLTQNKVFVCYNDKFYNEIKHNAKVISFGTNLNATYRAYNFRQKNNNYTFDVSFNKEYLTTISLSISGKYNAMNALGCVALCHTLQIPCEQIKLALSNFKNVERRFEFIKKINNADIFRDYAHHPTEIKNLLDSAKKLNYNKLIIYFQPHTYSRTIGLFNDFLKCFVNCDKLYLLPTYSAREQEINGGRSEDLYEKISKVKKNVYFINSFKDCLKSINENSYENNLIILVGAGDIGNLFDKTKYNKL